MKNLFLVLCGILMLAGLMGFNLPEADETRQRNADFANKKTETSKPKGLVIPDDLNLNIPGDSARTGQRILTFKKMENINKFYYLNGLEYTIYDVKLLHFIPAETSRPYFKQYTKQKEFDFIKINIELVNSNPQTINFKPFHTLLLNGRPNSESDDLCQKGMWGKIARGETKTGNIGFVVKDENTEKLEFHLAPIKISGPFSNLKDQLPLRITFKIR